MQLDKPREPSNTVPQVHRVFNPFTQGPRALIEIVRSKPRKFLHISQWVALILKSSKSASSLYAPTYLILAETWLTYRLCQFGMYIMFPIGWMYYFGTNLESRFSVPDFWPKPEATHRIPFERDELKEELERLKNKRLERRAKRLEEEDKPDAVG